MQRTPADAAGTRGARRRPLIGRLVCVALIARASAAEAAVFTWLGRGATPGWNDPANWGGAVPPDDGTAEIVFAPSSDTAIALDGPRIVHSITFATGADVTLQAGTAASTLTVKSGGVTRTARGRAVFAVPILGRSGLSLSTARGPVLTLADSFELAGINGYSGPTSLSHSLLSPRADAIPDASRLIVHDDAWLNLNGRAEAVGSLAGPVSSRTLHLRKGLSSSAWTTPTPPSRGLWARRCRGRLLGRTSTSSRWGAAR